MMDKYWWVIPAVLIVACFVAVAGINQAAKQMADEARIRREWIHKCIDAGGVPVDVLTYVKGIGQGERCVKSVDIVEVK